MTDGPKTRTITGYLVATAGGELRTVKTTPRLRIDEVAFPITVHIPITWGRVQKTSIEVTMPEPPEATVLVEGPLLDEVQ